MSRELDTTMELSREDWEEMWPHVQAVMDGAEEAALRTSIGKIIATLAEFPRAREEFLRVLYNPLATASSNSLRLFVTVAERKAFERAIGRGTRLLEGGYAEWERLDEEGNFWAWCYQGCDSVQKEEIAKSLGQHLYFLDGSAWQASYVKGNVNAPALLEQLLEEIIERSAAYARSGRYAAVAEYDTDRYGRYEALLKSQRRTHFLNMLARAHGDTQESTLSSEGSPVRDAPSVGGGSSPNDGRPLANGPSLGHSQAEEAKRKRSLDGESNLSLKRPKIAERRDHDGDDFRSLLQDKHQRDETQEVGRAGTPHPKKELDSVSRHKCCHQVVDWFRELPHKFRATLNRRMPFLKKLGKGKRSEPPEFELEDRRKHSSQSRSPGFRGGAGLNLRKPRKTSSLAALSLTTKDFLHFAPESTAPSQLHMPDGLPHSTPDSTAPLQSRTNKYSPHSLLEMAPSQSPHSSPRSIAQPKPCKAQDFVVAGDQEL